MLQLFETFSAVAQTGSLSKAAELLHITQPAVTRQIKALEHDLGTVLLMRTPQGVALTPVGQKVLVHVRAALAAMAACRRAVADSLPGAQNRLSIAAGSMLTQFVVPPVLTRFWAERPDLQVELYPGTYQDCLDRLLVGQVDLALISTPRVPTGLKAKPLFTDPVVIVTAPGSAMAQNLSLQIADLQGITLLALTKQTGLHQQLVKVLADAGISCKLAEHPTVETIKTMVRMGMGITLLPQSAVADEVAQGQMAVVPVTDWPNHGRTVLGVVRQEGSLPETVKAFLEALKARYREDK